SRPAREWPRATAGASTTRPTLRSSPPSTPFVPCSTTRSTRTAIPPRSCPSGSNLAAYATAGRPPAVAHEEVPMRRSLLVLLFLSISTLALLAAGPGDDAYTITGVALPGAPPTGLFLDYLAIDRGRGRVWVPAGGT